MGNRPLRRIRDQAAAATGLPAEAILVSVTHTHAGPDLQGFAGGVAANSALRAAVSELPGITAFIPVRSRCTDNGAMIAYAGYHRLLAGAAEPEIIRARPRWPLTELGNDTWTAYSSKT